jgi:ATP-dependent Clp protease ATP-binding subunit ClpA
MSTIATNRNETFQPENRNRLDTEIIFPSLDENYTSIYVTTPLYRVCKTCVWKRHRRQHKSKNFMVSVCCQLHAATSQKYQAND